MSVAGEPQSPAREALEPGHSGDAGPGSRSGEGASSLLQHLGRDSRSKAADELAHPGVAAALERWEAVHGTLRDLETVLADAVRGYARGKAPIPENLMAEVARLRALWGAHFTVLLETVQSQPQHECGAAGAPQD